MKGQSSSYRWIPTGPNRDTLILGQLGTQNQAVDIAFGDDLHRLIAATRRGGRFDYPDDYNGDSP